MKLRQFGLLATSLTLFASPVLAATQTVHDAPVLTRAADGYWVDYDEFTFQSVASLESLAPYTANHAWDGQETSRNSLSNLDQKKSSETRKEGRFVNSYDRWKVDTIQTTKTLRPYRIYDVYAWSERDRTTFANSYKVKTRVEWQDPVTKENLSSLTRGLEGPFDELSYSPWSAQGRKVLAGTGEDLLASVDKVVATNDASRKTSSGFVPAANTPKTSAGNSFGITSIYSGDAGTGEAGARFASGGATQRLSASNKAKAHGTSASVLTELLAAAAGQPDLFDVKGRKAWKLTSEGETLVFFPYDGNGNLVADPVRLAGNDLEGAAAGSAVHIKGFQVRGRSLTLSGNFRQAYLNKGKSHILVTL